MNSAAQNVPGDSKISLDPLQEAALSEIMLDHAGIVVHDNQLGMLAESVRSACEHFGHAGPGDYIKALREGPGRDEAIEYLMAGMTIGESYFFRDENQIRFIREVCLPDIIGRKRRAGDRMLRIWTAGCSRGQETYTLAMLLVDLLPDLDQWTLHLLGTDINTTVLAEALRGHYSMWSLRATPEDVQGRFFTHRGNEYIVKPVLRGLARFNYLNLVHDSFPSIQTDTHAIDLLLCRNVFIYFSQRHIRAVMEKLGASLADGGYLFISGADSVVEVDGLDYHYDHLIHYFRRAGKHSPRMTPAPAPAAIPPPLPPGLAPPEPPLPAGSADPGPLPPDGPATPASASDAGDRQAVMERLTEGLGDGRWSEVVAEAGDWNRSRGKDAMVLQFQARAEAHLGKLQDAARSCDESLELDPMDKHTHLIKGMVMMELDMPEAAEAALRKAIYLDRGFVEACYHLGLLLLRAGRRKSGMQQLQLALELADRNDPERLVHNAADMTFGRFAEILRNEMDMYNHG